MSELTHVHPDRLGEIDTSYGHDGVVDWKPSLPVMKTIAMSDADGHVYYIGQSDMMSPEWMSRLIISRFLPDGTLDLSFGTDGFVVTPRLAVMGDLVHNSVQAVWHGGRLVVATSLFYESLPEGPTALVFAARFDATGRADAEFGDQGIAQIKLAWHESTAVRALLVDDRSRVSLLLNHTEFNRSHVHVLRWTASGVPDDTFGDNGLIPLYYDRRSTRAVAMAPGRDDRILVAVSTTVWPASGSSGHEHFVVRVLADGSVDETYGVEGKAHVDLGMFMSDDVGQNQSLVTDRHARAYWVGAANTIENALDPVVVRFSAEGRPDASFGDKGLATVKVPGRPGISVFSDLSVQPDEKLLVTGSAGAPQGRVNMLVRLDSQGRLDLEFGMNGIVTNQRTGSFEHVAMASRDGEAAFVMAIANDASGHSTMLVYRYWVNFPTHRGIHRTSSRPLFRRAVIGIGLAVAALVAFWLLSR